MLIKVKRNLENNVFSTKLYRAEKDLDENAALEEKLENDFGPVVVKIDGTFCANITGTTGHITATPVEDINSANFKFGYSVNDVSLIKGAEINFSCDASKQVKTIINDIEMSPLEVAEQRCRIFESVMKDRIKKAVDKWKQQQTNFEEEQVDDLDISLVK